MPDFRLSAIPLRIYLTVVLLLLVFPVLMLAGIVAYRASRRSLQDEAIATLQTAADAYRDQVATTINRKRERAAAVLTEIELGCEVTGRMNGLCARETLRKFLRSEGAQGAVLMDRRRRAVKVGKADDVVGVPGSELAVFHAAPNGVVISTAVADAESGLSLAASYGVEQLAPSSELRRGNLLLLAEVDGVSQMIAGESAGFAALGPVAEAGVGDCLAGQDSSGVANSGKPQGAYEALRHVNGVGGGCVVSFVHESAVLGPATRLRRKMEQLAAGFALAAVVLAYLISFALTRPLLRLRQRVAGLKAGDYDSPVPVLGVGELRDFSYAFASMAEAIRISRQAVVASERRLRLAYTAAQLWVWEHDLRTGIIRWRNATVTLGDTQMDIKAFMALVHPEDRHAAFEAIRQAKATRTYESEYRLRTPQGDFIWLASWGQVVRDRDNGGEIMIGVSRDITEQKRAEELAREADRLAATSQMAASLAHEINNPLTSVLGAVHMAALQSEDKEQLHKLLAIADSETRRIAHIVHQLLGLYRPSIPTERVDLTTLLGEVIAGAEHAMGKKRQRLQARLDPGLMVSGYSEELRHAFTNVIVNASESAPEEGRIAVRARYAPGSANGARGVRVLVCDNGPGIAPETLARVLEPFVGTKPVRGTGLGLWVTRSVVLNHGGKLRVRSCHGRHSGTSISIYLPEKT